MNEVPEVEEVPKDAREDRPFRTDLKKWDLVFK